MMRWMNAFFLFLGGALNSWLRNQPTHIALLANRSTPGQIGNNRMRLKEENLAIGERNQLAQ